MTKRLTMEARRFILDAVHRALVVVDADAMEPPEARRPGGTDEIDHRLDALVEIVCRTTASRFEPFRVQIRDDICGKCPCQMACGICPLRDIDGCALLLHAPVLLRVIAGALCALRDPDYLATHPDYVAVSP
jgi:hypothetical protein